MTAARTVGAEVYRIDWLPGTDLLHGACHCGARRSDEDPVQLWAWLLDHDHERENDGEQR